MRALCNIQVVVAYTEQSGIVELLVRRHVGLSRRQWDVDPFVGRNGVASCFDRGLHDSMFAPVALGPRVVLRTWGQFTGGGCARWWLIYPSFEVSNLGVLQRELRRLWDGRISKIFRGVFVVQDGRSRILPSHGIDEVKCRRVAPLNCKTQ